MKKAISIIGLLIFTQSAFAQRLKNVYLMPSSIGGDMFWDLQNYWIEAGVGYSYGKDSSNIQDLKLGIICYSKPSYNDITSGLSAKKSTGFNFNIEEKKIVKRHFYISANFFYQHTKTIREGEFDRDNYIFLSNNSYQVIRNVICLYPKMGFQFINKRRIYSDIGIGAGLRYITSFSKNKIHNEINSGYETFSNKEFDKGSKLAQKIYFQIKIGYYFDQKRVM